MCVNQSCGALGFVVSPGHQQFLPTVQDHLCSVEASLQHLISTNRTPANLTPALLQASNSWQRVRPKSSCTNHPKPTSPRSSPPCRELESSNLHRNTSSFHFLLTVSFPVACNYFGMLVLMMCPVHLACSSVLLVICCFFVSCLPKGHYIISKTKHNSSIIYQARFTAHLSLISRPRSILRPRPTHTSQPTPGP